MSEDLIHIFDNSSCLTRRQMKDYVAGVMTAEERHAAEVHLNACPLCSDAVEGMLAAGGQGIAAMQGLNADFLQAHLPAAAQPHIARPAVQAAPGREKKSVPLWRNIAVAASLLLVAGVAWWLINDNTEGLREKELAQQLPPAAADTQQAPTTLQQPTTTAEPDATANTQQLAETSGGTTIAPVTAATEDAIAPQVMADMPAAAPQSRAFEPMTEEQRKQQEEEDKLYYNKSAQENATAAPPVASGSRRAAAPTDTVESSTKNLTEQNVRATAPRGSTANAASGDAAFNSGNWSAALKYYKEEMKSTDINRRQAAAIKAAQCHANLGNKQQATQILQNIVDEGGPERRTARRLLRSLK